MVKAKYNLDTDVIDLYKAVKSGSIYKFPKGFWQKPESPQNAKKVIQYLYVIENGFTKEDVISMFHTEFLKKNKLGTLTSAKSRVEGIESVLDVIAEIYEIKVTDFLYCPMNYWKNEKIVKKELTNYLIEMKCDLFNVDECVKCLTSKNLIAYGFSQIRKYGVASAIKILFPDIKYYQLKSISKELLEDKKIVQKIFLEYFKDNKIDLEVAKNSWTAIYVDKIQSRARSKYGLQGLYNIVFR